MEITIFFIILCYSNRSNRSYIRRHIKRFFFLRKKCDQQASYNTVNRIHGFIVGVIESFSVHSPSIVEFHIAVDMEKRDLCKIEHALVHTQSGVFKDFSSSHFGFGQLDTVTVQ